MYLILDSQNRIVDISEHALYVKRQKNGVVISCPEKEADAVYSANTDRFFPLERTGYTSGHTLAKVETIPSEVEAGYYFYHTGSFYTTDEAQAKKAKAKASEDLPEILVDQEYRLILLELEVA